jgi:chlorite dismutase
MTHTFTLFTGGAAGAWRVTGVRTLCGDPLPETSRIAITHSTAMPSPHLSSWPLIGVASHARYVQKAERAALSARQLGLGRPEATSAALIPIAKSQAWWDLTQEERREIFETRSRHIAQSLAFMPAIQRQLYHCRDLGQPFDFLTWFEFAPTDAARFDDLVGHLRETEEWRYVTREIDLRLTRD